MTLDDGGFHERMGKAWAEQDRRGLRVLRIQQACIYLATIPAALGAAWLIERLGS